MTNILEFKKRIKNTAPKGTRYILVCVDTDGSNAFIEHSDELNGYEVLGLLQWGANLKLSECMEEEIK